MYNDRGGLVFPLNPLDYIYQPTISGDDFFTYFQPLLKNDKTEETYVADYNNENASTILYVSYLGKRRGRSTSSPYPPMWIPWIPRWKY